MSMQQNNQKDTTEKRNISITKAQLSHRWKERLKGNHVGELLVRYKDADYFKDEDSTLDPDTLIYEEYVTESSPEEGHLTWGHVTVYPGQVKDTYFCTRGHYHANPNTEQYYLCMQGDGLIMYLNREGDCWCEELEEGSLHHAPAGVARRLINIGNTPLMISTCKPSNAGEDYESLVDNPFLCRVYDDFGEMAIEVDLPEKSQDECTVEDIEALLKL